MENDSLNHVRNNLKNKEVQHNMAGFPAQGSWGQNEGVSLADCSSEGSREASTSKRTLITGRIQILVVRGLRSPLPGAYHSAAILSSWRWTASSTHGPSTFRPTRTHQSLLGHSICDFFYLWPLTPDLRDLWDKVRPSWMISLRSTVTWSGT